MNRKIKDKYLLALDLVKNESSNFEKISKLLEDAHTSGESRASYALATWHLFGYGGYKKNPKKAVSLLKIAAKNNISSAHFDLAVCYEKGEGITKNNKKAYLHYISAALNGDDNSISEVGRCLYYGIGVEKDRKIAQVWFDKAKSLDVKIR